MSQKVVETWYEIKELSVDGLLKNPKTSDYGHEYNRFGEAYTTLEDVDRAILESGEEYTSYTVITVKRIGSA